jgi:hypothetical protein
LGRLGEPPLPCFWQKQKPDCPLGQGNPACRRCWFNPGAHARTARNRQRPRLKPIHFELVVVVDAETPEEPADVFAAQALRPMLTAADKANRVKNLMDFILL